MLEERETPPKNDERDMASQEVIIQHDREATEDPDWTSSSGSSDEEDPQQDEDDYDDDEENEVSPQISNTALKSNPLTFSKPHLNQDLHTRLAKFLPQLKASNNQLKDQDASSYQIDNPSENSSGDNEGSVVEMELGLGVLTERTSRSSEIQVSASDSEDVKSNSDCDVVASSARGTDASARTSAQRPVIEEL